MDKAPSSRLSSWTTDFDAIFCVNCCGSGHTPKDCPCETDEEFFPLKYDPELTQLNYAFQNNYIYASESFCFSCNRWGHRPSYNRACSITPIEPSDECTLAKNLYSKNKKAKG